MLRLDQWHCDSCTRFTVVTFVVHVNMTKTRGICDTCKWLHSSTSLASPTQYIGLTPH